VFLLLILTFALPAMAQDTVTDDQVNEIAKEVYCPVCESTPLDVCETRACADWRELIRTKLGQGQTKDEIFEYFAAQYGDRVLASPPKKGFNLILWIWPVFAVALGALLFARYLRGLRQAVGQAEPAPAVAPHLPSIDDDDYVARIENELAKR
jgi:cytochrome c-type biogenesis protein CcmH